MGIRGIAAAAALSMSMLSGAALAGEAGAPAPGPKAAKAENPAKRVCRNVVTSGTRLSVRTCRMKSDWDRDAENASKDVLDMQTNHAARDGAAVPR